ncbi:MAG: 30S ribosomal protein S16 [Thermoleophilaceae bacterium]
MAVRVRLTRVGSRKNPVWRVVVADQRSPRDGRIIEQIGHYDPHPEPSTIVIDRERLDHWLALGAEPTNTVRKLMRAPLTPAGAGKAAVAAATPQAETDFEAPAAGSEAAAPAAEPDASVEAAPPTDPAPEPASAADAPADASEEASVEAADSTESS